MELPKYRLELFPEQKTKRFKAQRVGGQKNPAERVSPLAG